MSKRERRRHGAAQRSATRDGRRDTAGLTTDGLDRRCRDATGRAQRSAREPRHRTLRVGGVCDDREAAREGATDEETTQHTGEGTQTQRQRPRGHRQGVIQYGGNE